MVAITAGMAHRQKGDVPVHKWDLARIDEAGSWENRYWQIGQIMSIDPYTVQEDDLGDLLPNIMVWKDISALLVENESGNMVGMVTASQLLNHYVTRLTDKSSATVKDIMLRDIPTVTEETLTTDAISIIRKHNITCLPVVTEKNELIGIVTERDLVNVADHFLQEFVANQGQKQTE